MQVRCIPCSVARPAAQAHPANLTHVRVSHRRPRGAAVAPRAAVAEPPAEQGGGGTGLLEKPGFDQSRPDGDIRTESGLGAESFDKDKKLGGGNYRVLLLDDKKHSEQLVVRVLCRVVPDVDELKAKNLFETSRQLGQAIVTTALKEHAEFYSSQIFRQGVRSTIEPDSTTL